MATATNKKYYTTYEAREKLMVSHSTVIEWIKAGKLRATKTLGGHRRIPKQELDQFIRTNRLSLTGRSDKRILIVDDDESIREGLREFFESHEYEVDTAADGFEAGVLAVERDPAVIILDLKMKGLNGFSACRLIKTNPHLKNIKILVLTGYPSKENIRKIMDLGADAWLAKPAEQKLLMKEVEQLVSA